MFRPLAGPVHHTEGHLMDHQSDKASTSFALMPALAKLASMELRARRRRSSSDQPNASLHNAYSPSRLAPSRAGSSVLMETTTPARRSRSIGWSSIVG